MKRTHNKLFVGNDLRVIPRYFIRKRPSNNPSVTCGDSSREKREPFMSRNIEHPMRRIHQRAIKRAWLTHQREKYERTIRVNAVYL